MKSIALLATAAAAAALAAPAHAAPVSGARVEALVGIDNVTLDSFGNQDDPSETGLVYGIGAGYDFEVARDFAIGLDVEATDSAAGFRFTSGVDDNSFDLGLDLYAGARATAAVSDGVNLYAKVGYTNVRTRLELINPTFPLTIETSDGGARVGAGAQFAVGERLYAGAEYRFSTYGEFDRHQALATLGLRL